MATISWSDSRLTCERRSRDVWRSKAGRDICKACGEFCKLRAKLFQRWSHRCWRSSNGGTIEVLHVARCRNSEPSCPSRAGKVEFRTRWTDGLILRLWCCWHHQRFFDLKLKSMQLAHELGQAELLHFDDLSSCRERQYDVEQGERESASVCVDAAAVDWRHCHGCGDCCTARTCQRNIQIIAKTSQDPSKISFTCRTTTKYSLGSAGSCESKSAAKLSMSRPVDLLTVSALRLSVVCSSWLWLELTQHFHWCWSLGCWFAFPWLESASKCSRWWCELLRSADLHSSATGWSCDIVRGSLDQLRG